MELARYIAMKRVRWQVTVGDESVGRDSISGRKWACRFAM